MGFLTECAYPLIYYNQSPYASHLKLTCSVIELKNFIPGMRSSFSPCKISWTRISVRSLQPLREETYIQGFFPFNSYFCSITFGLTQNLNWKFSITCSSRGSVISLYNFIAENSNCIFMWNGWLHRSVHASHVELRTIFLARELFCWDGWST